MTELSGYRLEAKLGEGGFAVVYKATQLSLDRSVAIKILKADLSSQDELRKRFLHESRLIARLNHPHIVHVIDCGFDGNGRPFYVMEHIKGVTLQQALSTGAVSLTRKLNFALQLAEGLAYAHKNGIVHRDIKPSNVLIDFEGCLKLADFGIALESGAADAVGEITGTAAYMAPEQWLGGHPAAPASDIYALGAMLYQMFSGQLPGARFASLSVAMPQLPRGIDELLAACLQESPSARPTAESVRQSLLRIIGGRHLSDSTVQRVSDNTSSATDSFELLDVLSETPDAAVYLFDDTRRKQWLVLRRVKDSPSVERLATKLMKTPYTNIERILGVKSNGRSLVVISEYLAGGAMSDRLVRPWNTVDFFRVAVPLLKALGFLHRLGIVHGKINPTNILFDESGTPKFINVSSCNTAGVTSKKDIRDVIQLFIQLLIQPDGQGSVRLLLFNHRFWQLPWPLRIALLRGCLPDCFVYRSVEGLLSAFDKARKHAYDLTQRSNKQRP